MLTILFTPAVIFYYVLTLICEYTTRYGIYQSEKFGKKNFLVFAKVLAVGVAIFNIYYSVTTYWWAFIGLISMNVIIFLVVDKIVKPFVLHSTANAQQQLNSLPRPDSHH